MTFGQSITSSPGRRRSVSVWRQIANTLTTEIRDLLVRLRTPPAKFKPAVLGPLQSATLADLRVPLPEADLARPPGQPFKRIVDARLIG